MPASRRPAMAGHHRRHRLAVVVAGILVAVIGAAAIIGWPARHAAPGAAGRAGQARSIPPSGAAASPPGAAGSPSAPGQLPSIDLAGLGWTDFHGVELPVSRFAGPRDVRHGLASGFADSPLGALLAAVNIGVRANAQWGPGIFGPTIRNQVTGPGTAALLSACTASYDQASRASGMPAGQPLGRAYVAEEAFRWVAYTPAGATVDIVSAGPGTDGVTVRAVTRIEVAWSGRDWRVIAPPGGDWGNSAAPLTSLSGYTILPNPAA